MQSPDIRIVLVEPSHPGNIGAVARAMKNMALAKLVLVRPRQFPHPEATARASGADDVLARRARGATLAEALARLRLRRRDHLARARPVLPRARRARGGAAHASQRGAALAGGGAVRRRAHRAYQRGAGDRARADPHPGQPRLSLAESRDGGAAGRYELFRARAGRGRGCAAGGRRAAGHPAADGAAVRAPRAGAGGDRFPRPHPERHAPDDAHPPLPAARRARPERGQHPARHPHRRAEPAPPRRRAAAGERPRRRSTSTTPPPRRWTRRGGGRCATASTR